MKIWKRSHQPRIDILELPSAHDDDALLSSGFAPLQFLERISMVATDLQLSTRPRRARSSICAMLRLGMVPYGSKLGKSG